MYSVLIVDDEAIIRRGLKSFVEKNGDFFVVALAEDGQEALDLAMEKKPRVCFVDINMPFVNGLDFIEHLYKVCPKAIVVVVTGYDDFSYTQKALKMHVWDYILKPVNEKEFMELLKTIKNELDDMDRKDRILDFSEKSDVLKTETENKSHGFSEKINAAVSYMKENYSDSGLSLNETAEQLHVSVPYLSRIFKEETGDNFQTFLQRIRIRKAIELLKDENNMIKNIAESCGYSSQHYFSTAFKKETGMSPAEYRKGLAERTGV